MSGRQLRRATERSGERRSEGEAVDQRGGGGEEGGEERRRKKTEGRPPSGLIKSITSSFSSISRARFFCPLPPRRPPSPSRPFSLAPNSHNCSFFPFAPRLTIVRRPLPLPGFLAVGSIARSFIYAYFDPSTCRPGSRRKPLLPLPSPFLSLCLFLPASRPSRFLVVLPRANSRSLILRAVR